MTVRQNKDLVMEKPHDIHNQADWEPSPVFLRYALATLLVGALGFGVVIFVMTPDQTGRYFGPAMGALIAVSSWGLLAKGKPLASVRVLAFGTWALATVVAITQAGVRTPVVVAYPVIIIRDCPLAESEGPRRSSLPMISNGYH